MKKLLALLTLIFLPAALILLPTLSFAQVRYVGPILTWSHQPCNQQAPEMAWDTGALAGENLYLCTGLNTWTKLGVAAISVSGLAASATTDTTDASNIIGGTLPQARLPVLTFTDGTIFLPPSACLGTGSANLTGTNGYTTAGTSLTPVVQVQTDDTAVVHTHTYVCTLTVPSRLTSGKGASITSVDFYYGVQGHALDTQAASLSAGTLNSSFVFSGITYQAPGTTAVSALAPVRADSGTLVITPAAASVNVATTTAGQFYTVKFAPAAAIALTTDDKQILLTVKLLNVTTQATTTNSPGLLVHYTNTLN